MPKFHKISFFFLENNLREMVSVMEKRATIETKTA